MTEHRVQEENKINILHIFSFYLPNTVNWAYNLISHTPGIKNYVFASKYLKNNFYHPEWHFVENRIADIETEERSISKFSKGVIRKALLFLVINLVGDRKKQLRKFLQKQGGEIDLIHVHFADVACDYLDILRQSGKPFVVSFYGLDYEYLPEKFPAFKKKYEQLYATANLFITEGAHGAGIIKRNAPKSTVTVVSLGVNVGKIPFYKREKKKGELSLLQVASLKEKKGHKYTLLAFAKARIMAPDIHLTLVGGGDVHIKEEIDQIIKDHQLESHVTLLNGIDFSILHNFLKNYQVFIHPSCYSRDKDCEGGAPVVLLDAQATGMPVISTKHCDIPGEVIDGETGWLSEEKDVDNIAEAILKAYALTQSDYDLYAVNARRHVETHFDIHKNAVALSNIYANFNNSKDK